MYTNHSIEKSDSEEESPPDGSGIPASIERPSSSVSRTSPEGEIADVLAALQRKTSALEAEVVRRQALEKDLRRRDAELDDFLRMQRNVCIKSEQMARLCGPTRLR